MHSKDKILFQKVKLNWMLLTGFKCFPQEYQHVHLLWLKKRSFTLAWKPNPPLRSVRSAHLCARADAASINQALHLHARADAASINQALHLRARADAASINQALLTLALKAPLFTWSVKSDSCYNVLRLAARAVWSRRFGAAQTMHSHKCDHVKFLPNCLLFQPTTFR